MDPVLRDAQEYSGVAAKCVTKCDSFLNRALDRKEQYFWLPNFANYQCHMLIKSAAAKIHSQGCS